MGNPHSETWMRKRKGCGREDLQKRKDLSLEWKGEWAIETNNNKYDNKYDKTVPGIRGVSPGEEMVGYGGKDLQKRKVLSLG